MSEDLILKELSADNVRAHVEHIIYRIPSRLAGSENGRRMAEYSRDSLRGVGVDAVVHELPGLVSFPHEAELRVLSPVETAIQANTLGHSLETLPDGISGDLVHVASGSFEDYEGKNVVGKITLSELSYSPARHEKQRIAGLKGSTGAIMMNWGHAGNEAVPFGSVKPVWGNPTRKNYATEMPTIPCIGIARTAGLKLKEMCESGQPVRVWFRTHVENGWRPVQITVGEIPSAASDDFVLVGGHQDSWYGEASTDNAAGNAVFIELARVFNMHREKLRRGLVFGFWTAHETGTMIGSSWYVDQYWDRLRRHLCAYLQIDQPAITGSTLWGASSNAELKRFHQAVEERVLPNRQRYWRRAVKNGDSSFFGLGVPMLHGEGSFTEDELKETALASLGWWHHSLECTIDKLDFRWMADHLRVYGAYVWELCTAPVLPFEFMSVAEQFAERLEELAEPGKAIGLGGVIDRARTLGETAARFDEIAEHWRGRYWSGQASDDGAADTLNECIKRVSRLLVPIQSTAIGTYGHDPYGFTPQTTMIPALYDLPELGRLDEDSEESWMLRTELVRERNRVGDALADANWLLEETIAKLD